MQRDGRLAGKIAIVTGGASGIGRASAARFGASGARVAIFDIDDERGEQAAEAIRGDGGQALFLHCDVSQADQVEQAVARVNGELGPPDVLMNCAAYLRDFKAVLETGEREWDASMAVTLKGCFLCARAVLPAMVARRKGSIINVSSVGGLVGFAGFAAYVSAKGGVIQLTRSIAIDYGRYGVRCNALCPGAIETPTNQGVQQADPALRQYQIDMSVLGRVGTPDEVASCALFLASDESSFVTGTCLVVDGGWTVR